MEKARKDTGLRHLGIYDDGGGFVAFTNNKKLIKTPEDMKGLRIRTEGGNAAQLAMIEAMGAKAVPLPWGDVTTALASNVADGQFNAPYVNAFAKFWEVNDYTSWIRFIFNTAVWSVSDKWFQELPKEYQTVIMTTAREAVMISRGINAQQSILDWEEGKKYFKDSYMPTPEVKGQWEETLKPAFYSWITEDFGLEKEDFNKFNKFVKKFNTKKGIKTNLSRYMIIAEK